MARLTTFSQLTEYEYELLCISQWQFFLYVKYNAHFWSTELMCMEFTTVNIIHPRVSTREAIVLWVMLIASSTQTPHYPTQQKQMSVLHVGGLLFDTWYLFATEPI